MQLQALVRSTAVGFGLLLAATGGLRAQSAEPTASPPAENAAPSQPATSPPAAAEPSAATDGSKPDAAAPAASSEKSTDTGAETPTAPATPEGDQTKAAPEAAAPEAPAELAASGESTKSDWQSLAAVQLTNPQDFGTGAFRRSVAIEVPPFRGLEPNIVLDYQSGQPLQYSGNGAGWMGIGWRLRGIPVIERGLRGGGSPNFNSSDIYMLAGDELISCASTIVSPGCAAGGNYASRVEDYRKIVYSQSTNYWTVFAKDGTQYEFRPTSETLPVDPSNATAVQLGNSYRWLLRKVTDPHGNHVDFTYTCSNVVYCRIDTITYGGALIKFYWETRPDTYSYATGLNTISVTHRLKTIDVKFASNRVRTYAVAYSTSSVVGMSWLTSVTQYASDASVDGSGNVTAGASPPLPPTTFSYSPENSNFESISNFATSANELVLGDFDGDGKTDSASFGSSGSLLYIFYANGKTDRLAAGLLSAPPASPRVISTATARTTSPRNIRNRQRPLSRSSSRPASRRSCNRRRCTPI